MIENIVIVLISTAAGGIVSFLTSLFFAKRSEKKALAAEIHKTRPEFDIVDYTAKSFFNSNKYGNDCDFELFVAAINTVRFSGRDYEVEYCGDIRNLDDWNYISYTIKNNGKTDITYLTIVSNFKKRLSLFPTSFLVWEHHSTNFLNYYVAYDKRKIRSGESLVINIFYHKDYFVGGSISAPLSLVFKDDNGRTWSQALWAPDKKLYESRLLSNKEYKTMHSIDDALKCFKNPWLW